MLYFAIGILICFCNIFAGIYYLTVLGLLYLAGLIVRETKMEYEEKIANLEYKINLLESLGNHRYV